MDNQPTTTPTADPDPAAATAKPSLLRRFWTNYVRPIVPVVLVICSIRSSLADYYHVPTGSMKPTILEGDRVFVNKLAYDLKFPFTGWSLVRLGEPQRGDIVVFDHPGESYPLVKRIVGVPGDTIEVRSDRVFLNGAALEYDVQQADAPDRSARLLTEALPGHPHTIMIFPGSTTRSLGPVTLGPDEFVVLGDNRDQSKDSRYIGLVTRPELRGRALGNVFSLNPSNWAPRFDRFITGLK
jgi:signal peptidase I